MNLFLNINPTNVTLTFEPISYPEEILYIYSKLVHPKSIFRLANEFYYLTRSNFLIVNVTVIPNITTTYLIKNIQDIETEFNKSIDRGMHNKLKVSLINREKIKL